MTASTILVIVGVIVLVAAVVVVEIRRNRQ